MDKNRLFSNAAMSVLQVLVTSVTLFVLYKVLINTIGVKQLGIWSLVMATGSLTQLANFGLVGGVAKFVATYVAREDHETASRVVQTAAISLALSTGTVLAIIYICAGPILSLLLPQDSLKDGLAILPYSFLSLWLLLLAGVFQAGLDGYQRIDSRNSIVMIGSIIYLGLCSFFAMTWGLVGVAFASVLQNLWLLLATLYLLRKRMPSLPVWRYTWDKALFKVMLGYGLKVQLTSVAIMVTDPVTKMFLSRFGGLSAVGYYEMANRMVQQLRSLLVTPGFTLVPAAADLKERASERIQSLYFSSYDLVFCLSAAAYGLVIMYAPLISRLWIGHYEQSFVTFCLLLSIGLFINILAVPAYFINLGTGELTWNLIGHVMTAVVNLIGGFLLGSYFGASGVVTAWVIALSACSVLIIANYHLRHGISVSRLMPRSSIMLISVCSLGVAFIYLISPRYLSAMDRIPSLFIHYAVFPLALLVVLWFHPSRKQVFGLVRQKFA